MEKKMVLPQMEQNVGNSERYLSVISGSLMLYHALSGKKNGKEALLAGYLIFRGASGYCPLYDLAGKTLVEGPKHIRVKTSVTVNKPRSEVYAFWRLLSNLPLFMKHLDSVTVTDDRHSEWQAKIPGNLGTVSWKSEITSDLPDEFIAWRSLPGSQIENSGLVKFIDAGSLGTEVHAEISYHPPIGKIGESLGRLLNPLFEGMIKEDIRNFSRYMETGELLTIKGPASGK